MEVGSVSNRNEGPGYVSSACVRVRGDFVNKVVQLISVIASKGDKAMLRFIQFHSTCIQCQYLGGHHDVEIRSKNQDVDEIAVTARRGSLLSSVHAIATAAISSDE
jgi:hypothetical protein